MERGRTVFKVGHQNRICAKIVNWSGDDDSAKSGKSPLWALSAGTLGFRALVWRGV